MRKINKIVIHCTATQQTTSVQSIKNYWRDILKWKNPGYHYIIDKNGYTYKLAEDSVICNGAAGFNANSIHIAYIGGIDIHGKPIDNRTTEQKIALKILLIEYSRKYTDFDILGHYQLPNVKKACPCFDAKKEYCIYNRNYK